MAHLEYYKNELEKGHKELEEAEDNLFDLLRMHNPNYGDVKDHTLHSSAKPIQDDDAPQILLETQGSAAARHPFQEEEDFLEHPDAWRSRMEKGLIELFGAANDGDEARAQIAMDRMMQAYNYLEQTGKDISKHLPTLFCRTKSIICWRLRNG